MPNDILSASLSLEIWVAELDAQGPYIPIKILQKAIENAPDAIREAPDYHFYRGFMFGRMVGEGLL